MVWLQKDAGILAVETSTRNLPAWRLGDSPPLNAYELPLC